MMFGGKKRKSHRPVFGFPCSPQVAEDIRSLSSELTLPIYPVAEHALDLGTRQITADLQDDDSQTALHNHLLEQHFLSQLLDIENSYDRDKAIELRRWQFRHWEMDTVAHKLVAAVEREGVPIKILVEIAEMLIKDARSKRESRSKNIGR